MSAPRQRPWLHALGTVAGLLLSIGLASTAFERWHVVGGIRAEPRFPIADFARELPAQWPWLVVFLLLEALIIPSRAVQWQRALARHVPLSERYHFIAIGAFIHNVLPGKLGDLSRAFLLARTQRMPFVRSLGSVVVCKLMEFTATMILVVVALSWPRGAGALGLSRGLWIAVAACGGLIVGIVLLAHFAASAARGLERRRRWVWMQKFLHEVSHGLGTARSFRGMLKVLALSFPGQLFSSIAYGLALRGIGIPNGEWAGPLVIGALSFSQSVPGMPSDVGLYYLVTAWVARALGAPPDRAAAFALLTHLGSLVPQLVQGGVSLAVRKIPWRELRRSTHIAAEEARHVARADLEPLPP